MRKILINIILCILIFYMLLPLAFCGLAISYYKENPQLLAR